MNAPTLATNQAQPPALRTGDEQNKSIVGILKQAHFQDNLKHAAAGTGLTADRLIRVLLTSVQQNPGLKECDPMTLFGAMVVSASLGLEPNTPTGQAYLIPFNINKKTKGPQGQDIWVKTPSVQFIIGYRGMITLARRSGQIKSIRGDVVYDGDEFSYEYGSNQHLRHKPKGSREGRRPIYAYAHAILTDGGEQFEVLPYDEILRIRNSSQGYQSAMKYAKQGEQPKTPWIQNEHEMSSKTMVRRLFKFLPMSIEMIHAQAVDAFGDHGIGDYSKFAGNKDQQERAFVEAEMKNYNQGTGEVIDGDAEEVTTTNNPPPAEKPKAAGGRKKAVAEKQAEQQPSADEVQRDDGPEITQEEANALAATEGQAAQTTSKFAFGD